MGAGYGKWRISWNGLSDGNGLEREGVVDIRVGWVSHQTSLEKYNLHYLWSLYWILPVIKNRVNNNFIIFYCIKY